MTNDMGRLNTVAISFFPLFVQTAQTGTALGTADMNMTKSHPFTQGTRSKAGGDYEASNFKELALVDFIIRN